MNNIDKCVEVMFSKNIETQKKIAGALFSHIQDLANENLITSCLNDEEKREWFDEQIQDTVLKMSDELEDLKASRDVAVAYLEHMIEELDKRDMLHNGEDTLMKILKDE